jgi:hypothetical protein
MSIFTASNQATVRDAAVSYFYEGLSVIPLTGKQASTKWAVYQDEIALPQTIHQWHKSGLLSNVGIVCGAVSKNLVVMDLDGAAACEAFERQFPYLLDTFSVATGSGKGKHYYYRVDNLPPTTRLGFPDHQGIEMRANGCYIVAAPSIHPDTHYPYRPISSGQIRKLPHLNGVKEWLYSQLARKNEPARKPIQRTIYEGNTSRWANAALGYECRDMSRTPQGNRAKQLFTSARNLGQIVGDGLLSQSTVEAALLASAVTAGLSEREAQTIIASGMTKGMAEPRSVQWQRRSK